jgi:hypothetical protein
MGPADYERTDRNLFQVACTMLNNGEIAHGIENEIIKDEISQ